MLLARIGRTTQTIQVRLGRSMQSQKSETLRKQDESEQKRRDETE
jgi:hypothetical protein